MKKASFADWVEAGLSALDVLLRFGLVTGAGVAAAFGQFLLALLLVTLATALFLRVWRKRRLRKPQSP
jgi:hypothetical protein